MNNISPISWLSYSIPKAGNRDQENEDALFPASGIGESNSDKPSAFIVADGATQTSFSGLWARCLVESCAGNRLNEFHLFQSIENARNAWQQSFDGKEIPWHAVEKIKQGAFSAIIWLEVNYSPLHPGSAFSWKALAVGDCCLFIARNQSIYLSLPLQNPADFLQPPVLVPSNKERLNSIRGKIQTARGSLKRGDQLLLASDAISAWIMKQTPADGLLFLELMQSIKNSNDQAGFSRWINSQRKSGELKNDDTTMIFIELGD